MKKYIAIGIGLLFVLFGAPAIAQEVPQLMQTIPVQPITVSTDKTVNIIFPYEIKNVDRGTKDVLAQVTKGVLNILQLKAARIPFAPTNITVVTADGQLYSFLVSYAKDPTFLNLSFKVTGALDTAISDHPVRFIGGLPDEGTLKMDDSLLRHARPFLHISSGSERMVLSLRSIYYKDGLLWFLFRLHNNSLLSYIPARFRFAIKDNKRVKRGAIQALTETPVYSGILAPDYGRSSRYYLFAFQPFTLPKDKRMEVQVRELFGGRILELAVKHRVVLKTKWWKP